MNLGRLLEQIVKYFCVRLVGAPNISWTQGAPEAEEGQNPSDEKGCDNKENLSQSSY